MRIFTVIEEDVLYSSGKCSLTKSNQFVRDLVSVEQMEISMSTPEKIDYMMFPIVSPWGCLINTIFRK